MFVSLSVIVRYLMISSPCKGALRADRIRLCENTANTASPACRVSGQETGLGEVQAEQPSMEILPNGVNKERANSSMTAHALEGLKERGI